jgi:hypothetical protein
LYATLTHDNSFTSLYFFKKGNLKISLIKDHEYKFLQSRAKSFYNTEHKTRKIIKRLIDVLHEYGTISITIKNTAPVGMISWRLAFCQRHVVLSNDFSFSAGGDFWVFNIDINRCWLGHLFELCCQLLQCFPRFWANLCASLLDFALELIGCLKGKR